MKKKNMVKRITELEYRVLCLLNSNVDLQCEKDDFEDTCRSINEQLLQFERNMDDIISRLDDYKSFIKDESLYPTGANLDSINVEANKRSIKKLRKIIVDYFPEYGDDL